MAGAVLRPCLGAYQRERSACLVRTVLDRRMAILAVKENRPSVPGAKRRIVHVQLDKKLPCARKGYKPRSMARSSRKRIFPLSPPREITKRTCPCSEVLAYPASVRTR